MRKNRFQVRRELALVAAAVAVVAVGCGDTKTNGSSNVGGSAGTAGWTYLPPGSDAGTSSTPGTGGTSAGSGGNAGNAGSAGNAGTGGVLPPTPFECGHLKPNQPLLTSFDGFMQDRWTSPGNVNGGVYIYPEPLMVQDGDFLRYQDPVATYSGIGVWFAGCIDASKLKGVRFKMSGDAGKTKSLQFYLVVNRNRDVDEVNLVGACIPANPADPWLTCRPPVVRLPVTPDPTTQTVLWTDFEGGLPTNTTDGSDILALQWSFDWSEGDPTYDADLIIDDLELIPADDGAGGAGGAGGEANGGAPSEAGAGGAQEP
jgi:hypothetical protein